VNMRGLSRSKLRSIDADRVLAEGVLPDKRTSDISTLTSVDESVYETLREVFAGTALLQDQRKVKLVLKLRTDVAVAWGQTRDAFLEIGRALNDVDRELDAVERDRLKTGFRRLFPFSETVASQFRVIARAVDDGSLSRDLVPGSYGAAYQMALLTPAQREIAKARGLLRPDISRDALIDFRKQIDAVQPRPSQGLDPAKMRAELQRLERQRRKGMEELLRLRRRIREIKALLSPAEVD
jgi:hypothetical protein